MKRPLRVLVTCGPTREPLDPVRFISNRSTGTLGFELVRAFVRRGHRVVLAAGPVDVPADLGRRPKLVRFETARELHRIALREFPQCDAVCMTAAVADFRPRTASLSKIKRDGTGLTVRFVPNPDILADLGRRKKPGQVLVGFSVESAGLAALEMLAADKLRRKRLDLIAAQSVGTAKNPFGAVRMNTLLLRRDGGREFFKNVAKSELAARIVLAVESQGGI